MLIVFIFLFICNFVFSDNFIEPEVIMNGLSLSSYRFIRETPKNYILNAIKLFNERNGKIIVEIGSMRYPLTHDIDNGSCIYCQDGHSTLFWMKTNSEVFSVDINPENTKMTKNTCNNINVNAITQDGIEFLRNFNKPIDLLYLDAWDAIEETDYAEKHLEAYEAAKDKLHNNSLILIDDTDIYKGGKGKLVIPKALEDGYKIIFEGRQTLLSKI